MNKRLRISPLTRREGSSADTPHGHSALAETQSPPFVIARLVRAIHPHFRRQIVPFRSSPRVTACRQNASSRTDFPYRSQNAHSYTPVRTCAKQRPSLNSVSQVRLHCSQGGVKFPTGGKAAMPSPRAPSDLTVLGVSRSGVIPEPTVIVRMKENGIKRLAGRAWAIAPAPIRHVVSRNPEETGYGKDDE